MAVSEENVLFGYIGEILNYEKDENIPVVSKDLDDCALIKISETESMAVTSDFVRGSGFSLFRMGLMNYYDAGYYLISANLSDLASMGAKPIGLTTILRYSPEMNDDDFKEVFKGMKEAADLHGARIIGGDVGSYKADVFAATAFGKVETKKALLRKNVKDGDLLCVTGQIGRPVAAMTYFEKVKPAGFELSHDEEQDLLDGWRRPPARVQEGLLLAEYGLANACQDVSDGLKATVETMSKLSGKHFTLHAADLPINPSAVKIADHLGIDPVHLASSASVDFELLFTVPPEKIEECKQRFAQAGLKMSVIGKTNAIGKNIVIDKDGTEKDLPGIAWNQQAGDTLLQSIITKKTGT
jgi:thiamine-monophosphate kinase